MTKHKKNVYCISDMHEWNNNICVECGDIQDYLFAPDYWFAGVLLGHDRPHKRHKKV